MAANSLPCPLSRCLFPPSGSLLAFECLSEKLGRLFEPYVIQILPMLLNCFGDGSQAVRRPRCLHVGL